MVQMNPTAQAPAAGPPMGSDEAAAPPAKVRSYGLLSQPSTWSAIWAIVALLILGVLRASLRKS